MATFGFEGLRVDNVEKIRFAVTESGGGSPAFGDYVVYTTPAGRISRVSFIGAFKSVLGQEITIKKRVASNASSPVTNYTGDLIELDFTSQQFYDQTALEDFWLNDGDSLIINVPGGSLGAVETVVANLSAIEYVPEDITNNDTFDS